MLSQFVVALIVLGFAFLARNAFSKNDMEIRRLSESAAMCNDGSPPAYYHRTNPASSQWVIYLQAWENCFHTDSCNERAHSFPIMVSTNGDPPFMRGHGILSQDPAVNPDYNEANAVYIRYCSSDVFTGTLKAGEGDNDTPYHFQGAAVIDAVLQDIHEHYGLGGAKEVVFTGQATGGAQGVLFNIDRVADMLKGGLAPHAKYYPVVDTAWFTELPRYGGGPTGDCSVITNCSIRGVADIAMGRGEGQNKWGALLPPQCEQDPASCMYAKNIVSELRTPTFFMQSVYDCGFLMGNGVFFGTGKTEANAEYLEKLGQTIRDEMAVVPTAFIKSCANHIMLDSWATDYKIRGQTPLDAFRLFRQGQLNGPVMDECDSYQCGDCPMCPGFLCGAPWMTKLDELAGFHTGPYFLKALINFRINILWLFGQFKL